jgi:SAM-dependent methyltransferase
MSALGDWTVGFFDEPYTELFPFPGDAQSDAEVEALVTLLPSPPAQVLDLACGPGRHAIRLAERGYEVTGVDSSAEFLAAARAAAAARGLTSIEFVEGDMRALTFERRFDAAVNLFTAWGYFDDDTNQRVLHSVAAALRPQGRFVLDVMNRDWLASAYTAKDWVQLRDGAFAVSERAFDPVAGTNVVSHRWHAPDGELRERRHELRVYTATELDRMLRAAGLVPTAWYGGFELEPLRFRSRRLLVVSQRTA